MCAARGETAGALPGRLLRIRLRRSPREAGSQAGDAEVSPAALSLPEARTAPAGQAQVGCSLSLPFLGASPAALPRPGPASPGLHPTGCARKVTRGCV